MVFYSNASASSTWKGYEYYKDNKVIEKNVISENVFSGRVNGGKGNIYDITIDIDHPKKSTCTCKHAEGTRRICKHKIALFFSIFKEEAEEYYSDITKAREEQEKQESEMLEQIDAALNKMTKAELRSSLLHVLYSGPDYQLNNFYYDYILRHRS